MLEKIDGYTLLSQRVYDAMKKSIISGTLKAGDRVVETVIAKELGVSRTPVREALRILNSEGYVKLMPNSSFLVCEFTEKDVRDILQVRGAIEGEAARIAAECIGEEQKQLLRSAYAAMEAVPRKIRNEDEAAMFSDADVNFHQAVMEIAGNKQIISISNSLRDRMYRTRVAFSTMENSVEVCQRHHYDIMTAILEGQGDDAAQLSRFHTNYIASEVLPKSADRSGE